MIVLIQRVSSAAVRVEERLIAEIGNGMLVFVAVQKIDNLANIVRMADKLLNYRLFADVNGKMNLNIQQIQGSFLLVPQFTLAANTRKGLRPSFADAATPQEGEAGFNKLADLIAEQYSMPELGKFGADMQVSLVNDGPVTFWIQT